MTADDLQENRRVCKFPCTSRGEGPQGRPPQAAVGGRPPAAPQPRPPAGGRGALRARPRQAAAWEQGQAAGRRPVYSPYKAQEAGRRPPLRSSGGRPCGAPCPGEARAACGRLSPRTNSPKGEKPYPLAPSSSGCSCLPRRAASSAAPVSESSAQRLVGFFRGSSCPKGTK